MTDFSEALKIIAVDVVGLSNPDDIDGEEMLYWRDIRRALETSEPKPFQRKCWQAGTLKDHLCGFHCSTEPTHEEIDDFVREYRQEQQKQLDQDMENFRRLREGLWND